MLKLRHAIALLLTGGMAWCGWNLRVIRVTDNDMAPSLRAGDWLVLGPPEPDAGDVVRIDDPNEAGRKLLRRVVATEGHPVRFRGGRLVTGGKGVPIKEMGRTASTTVLAEANRWLIQHRDPLPAYTQDELVVGDGELYLLADSRDAGVDSRWWGALPKAAVEHELWLRIGEADAWRGHVLIGSEDGPWAKPVPRP